MGGPSVGRLFLLESMIYEPDGKLVIDQLLQVRRKPTISELAIWSGCGAGLVIDTGKRKYYICID
jgi:hypothetical protein